MAIQTKGPVVATRDRRVRVPDDLPLADAERSRLEGALREKGYVIVPFDIGVASALSAFANNEEPLRAAITELIDEADEAEVGRLQNSATVDSDDLDERFWGPAPDSVTAAKAIVADLSDQFAQRRKLASESISRDEAAELLGVAAQSITARLTSRKLVGFKVGREWRVPTWQFDPDSPAGVLNDLQALQAAFPGGPVSLSRWMRQAQPEFGGRTARDEMIRHGSQRVIDLAHVLTATAW